MYIFAKRAIMIASAAAALLPARGAPLPAAVFHLERNGDAYQQAYGRLSYEAGAPADDAATLFDAASLTKILATAPSALLLAEAGKLDLEAPVARYFPECGGNGKDGMTVRHLLTHSSGLPAGLPALPAWEGQAAAHALACSKAVTDAPGTAFRYSDINFILLGQLVQRVSGMPLDECAQRRIFAPLKMTDTGYLPLAGGELDGVRILSADSVRLLTTVQSPPGVAQLRGMGMDIDSPFARTFYAFLSNRVVSG